MEHYLRTEQRKKRHFLQLFFCCCLTGIVFSNMREICKTENCFSRPWSHLAHLSLMVMPKGSWKHGSTNRPRRNANAKQQHPDPRPCGQRAAWPTSVFLEMLQSKLVSYRYFPSAIYLPQIFQRTFADLLIPSFFFFFNGSPVFQFFLSRLWWNSLHRKYKTKLFSLQFCFRFELWGHKYIQSLNVGFFSLVLCHKLQQK